MTGGKRLRVFTLAAAAAASLRGQAPIIPEMSVDLPPMVVEADHANGLRWRYGELPGMEVLSCCDDEVTKSFLLRVFRQDERLRLLIPGRFLMKTSLPKTFILFRKSLEKSMASEMSHEMEKVGASAIHSRFKPLPHLRLADADSTAIFAILNDGAPFIFRVIGLSDTEDEYSHVVLSADYLRFLLEANAPATPYWFGAGVARFYSFDRFRDSKLQFAPEGWTSDEAAHSLKENPGGPQALLPMSELLVPGLPRGDAGYCALWQAQAELFVRWALTQSPTGKDALWTFVDRLQREPLTEAIFRRCFGLNFADMRDELRDFLSDAVDASADLGPVQLPTDPKLVLRDAQPVEIRRIRGDWARRSLKIIRPNYPKLVPLYLDQARTTLQRAYDSGGRDSRLLASLGWLALEGGDKAAAGTLFEAVGRSGAVAPAALTELARLRLLAALDHPEAARGKFSEAQESSIFDPLERVRAQRPLLQAAYSIAALTVAHLPHDPTARERDTLAEGAWNFARDTSLVITAVYWEAKAGDCGQALGLADLGLWHATDPDLLKKLSGLRSRVAALPPMGRVGQALPP